MESVNLLFIWVFFWNYCSYIIQRAKISQKHNNYHSSGNGGLPEFCFVVFISVVFPIPSMGFGWCFVPWFIGFHRDLSPYVPSLGLSDHFPDGPVASHLLSLVYKNCDLSFVCQMFHAPTNLSLCPCVLPLSCVSSISIFKVYLFLVLLTLHELFMLCDSFRFFNKHIHHSSSMLVCILDLTLSSDTQLGLKQLRVSHVYF